MISQSTTKPISLIRAGLSSMTFLRSYKVWLEVFGARGCYYSHNTMNPVGIQTIHESMRNHLFGPRRTKPLTNLELFENIKCHLKKFQIPFNSSKVLDLINLDLPKLKGPNIDDHFRIISQDLIDPYLMFLTNFINFPLPLRPKIWILKQGWTKYDSTNGKHFSVKCPDENIMVFDLESLVSHGNFPVIATAVSHTAWYSWCSQSLFEPNIRMKSIKFDYLIPLDGDKKVKKLIIGHNVGFDRSFIKDQYSLDMSSMYFLDTMSLHIAVAGLTSFQRVLFLAKKSGSKRKEAINHEQQAMQNHNFSWSHWMERSCLNNLNDVYQFYCKKKPLKKHLREIFLKGDINDIIKNFQKLCEYCSLDVQATFDVLKELWPKFLKRFSHPATLAGMFEMGLAYLPINDNWFKYIDMSEKKYTEIINECDSFLINIANKIKDDDTKSRKNDLWLMDLNWSLKKVNKKKVDYFYDIYLNSLGKEELFLPKWYHELCTINDAKQLKLTKLSISKRTAIHLLKLMWNGHPLHFSKIHGWGYLVPNNLLDCKKIEDTQTSERNNLLEKKNVLNGSDSIQFEIFETMFQDANVLNSFKQSENNDDPIPYQDVLSGFFFYKLPHKENHDGRVGNPLSKYLHQYLKNGILTSFHGKHVDDMILRNAMSSYWKNNADRIRSQMVIILNEDQLPNEVLQSLDYNGLNKIGAILPRIVTSGTVTRRSVEPTWLTASNAYCDRIGSELKSMVQSPPGYCFVGADVDSQELWIAALMGDSLFGGLHGCTAFGWMTLQGNKIQGTDLHSRTANMLGLDREHAKIFNYGRIYGAGQKFAEKMLLKFNSKLSKKDAETKAKNMFLSTKGRRINLLEGVNTKKIWHGGSESHMFNKLEQIANDTNPQTPVLGARMSSTLETTVVNNDFMTSRVNWVVQSSAVDYLHLMLVCMRWLFKEFNIKGKFCISIHDEVRYLVCEEDRYRAALALQITNLFTRSMFAYKLNFDDLPQSVAFFSSVEIDTCLRKDAKNDCITPSNPQGLKKEYNIKKGESLSISDILQKTDGQLNK